MKQGRAITAVITILAISLFAFAACKKKEKMNEGKALNARMEEMMQRSLQESKKEVAAKVNGEPITMAAVFKVMNTIGSQYLARGMKQTPELEQRVRKEALHNAILQELAIQEAKKRGMQAKPAAIDVQIRKIKLDAGSDDAYRKFLASNALTEEELRKQVERNLLFDMIAAQEVDAKIAVSDAALRARYEKERAAMKSANHPQMTFEASRAGIEQKMMAEAAEKRMSAWEKELRKKAKIEIIDKKLAQADKN